MMPGDSAVCLKFEYTNWRDEDHRYLVEPEKIDLGPYYKGGRDPHNPPVWVMHARVVERDGELRPGRRTFLMSGMRNIESVRTRMAP